MSEKESKTKIYHEILTKKEKLTVLKNKGFNFEFPKQAFDRICQFYGKLSLNPISFVSFTKSSETTEYKKSESVFHSLESQQIGSILDAANCFLIFPKNYFETYDEGTMSKIAPKMKNKAMKDIAKKAEMKWDELADFCEIQIVTTEVQETSKITISYEIVENIFKYIPILQIVFVNGKKIDFSYYSYKSILEKCGIKLENMIPYLKYETKQLDRIELMNQIIPLYEKVKIREIKDRIKRGELDQHINMNLGTQPCKRYDQIPFDQVEKDQNEANDYLNDLMKKIDEKKNNIKNHYENIDNQIIEIRDKDDENKNICIRKKIYDAIISDEEDFDIYKTYDLDGNEVTVSKEILKEYENNSPLIKIYNKNNSEEDFILIEINDIEENLKNFNYMRKKETFKGINKNDELLEEEWEVMDIECISLTILEESKPLYTIPEKEKLFEKTKNDLLGELNNDNKDIILYNKKSNFIPLNFIEDIKKRDKDIKNNKIKYKIKNQINKKEIITVEYKDIFEEIESTEYIMINNKDNPDENIVVNKNDLLKKIKEWDELNNDLKIKNEINNNELEINPIKITIKKIEKEEAPKNYEDAQEKIKKMVVPENVIIKSNNNFIKQIIVKKIIDNIDPELDIYYINDINNKKIKVSKKQLIKDSEDPSLQFISISTKEEPKENIIVLSQELYTQLEADPMDESFLVTDKDGNKHTLKKTSFKINPIEIEDINFDEQPDKIKNDIIKGAKDYYYLYEDPEKKCHYIRGDILKLIKNYKSKYPIENFEVEDEKENKVIIPKEIGVKLIDNPDEAKYILLDNEENVEPVMAEFNLFKKGEGDADEPLEVNKEGKKIKLKKTKVKKLKKITKLGEQPEEKEYEKISYLMSILQKKESSSDIYKIKDSKNNDIFIYEDTLNKIAENNSDPEKTLYKCNSSLKEEIICGKNVRKSSPNKFIKLVDPNIILDKNEFEKVLKDYKLSQKKLIIKDAKGNQVEIDPLKIQIYKPSPEETEFTKILPADFSDINEKLLLDIFPQNKLVLLNDINNQPMIIKKKEGENLLKYPKTTFDTFSLYDKDGKKIKISRKEAEKNVNDNSFDYIEIIDNTNNENKNEIILEKELVKALNDKENEDFEINNKDGKKIKLNKKNITIVKQNNQFIDIPQQGEEIKNKLLSEIKDSFIKIKDSKNNKDIIIRNSQINEINNHKQKAPFINYEILDIKKEKVYTTKDICKKELSEPETKKLILCYDEAQKDKEFLIPLEKIKLTKMDGDDLFDIDNDRKIIFRNLRIKKLEEAPILGIQQEEEKMVKVATLINKINSGPLNKNYKTNDIDGKLCFVSNNYINKLQNEYKNDENDTKYKINDAFGKNNITLSKSILKKDNIPGEYIIIKNKKDNKDYLVDLNDLLYNLRNFKSIDDQIIINNSADNKPMKLNPLDIEIVPPFNNYPFQKIVAKKNLPVKNEDNKEDILKINKEKEKGKEKEKEKKKEGEERKVKKNDLENKDEIKERIRLRSAPARHHIPEKKTYKIRRAIIYKKQKK